MEHYFEHYFEADTIVPLLQEPLVKASDIRKPEEPVFIVNITEENQNQVKGNHISRVPSVLRDINSEAYKPKLTNPVKGNHISRVPSVLRDIKSEAYEPKLISIGPYIKEPGIENSVKEDFQKSFFGTKEGLKEHSTKRLTDLKDMARSWYAENTEHINDAQFVEMLLLDGCFILEFFYKMNSGKDDAFMNHDGKVAQTLIDMLLFENQLPFFVLFELHKLRSCYGDNALQESDYHQNDNDDDDDDDALSKEFITLVKKYNGDALSESDHHQNDNDNDALLKLFITLVKKYNDDALQEELNVLVKKYEDNASLKKVYMLVKEYNYEALLKELINLKEYDAGALLKLMKLVEEYALLQQLVVLVKQCFVDRVPKLTPQNVVSHEYKPTHLPKHLLHVVYNLCIPSNGKSDHTFGGNIELINTATELEMDGVSFKKIGKVYAGYNDDEGPNFNANDCTTLFDIDFNKGIIKIPCFKIEDSTETFFRNMIAYEQHSTDVPKYFTDFAWLMDQLIHSHNDVILLRRRGIIVNLLATDETVAKMFNNMCEGVVLSTTFSEVYNKVTW